MTREEELALEAKRSEFIFKTKAEVVEAKAIPIIFARVSTSKQRKGLPAQVESLKKFAKEIGLNKKPVVFSITQSGRAGELKSIKELVDLVSANPNKTYVAVFRDVTRFARDTLTALKLVQEFSLLGVPILFRDGIPVLIGRKPMGNRSGDLLFAVLSIVAETGKQGEIDAREVGEAKAAEGGVVSGEPRDFFLKSYKKNGISAHRVINDLMPDIIAKKMSKADAYREAGVTSSTGKKIFNELMLMSKTKQKEFLEVIDAILEAEKKIGKSRSVALNKRTRRTKALHRVTVAYLQNPDLYPRPDIEGNPNIAELTGEKGSGTIADAIANPSRYQRAR